MTFWLWTQQYFYSLYADGKLQLFIQKFFDSKIKINLMEMLIKNGQKAIKENEWVYLNVSLDNSIEINLLCYEKFSTSFLVHKLNNNLRLHSRFEKYLYVCMFSFLVCWLAQVYSNETKQRYLKMWQTHSKLVSYRMFSPCICNQEFFKIQDFTFRNIQ